MNIFYFVNKWPRSHHSARFDKILSMTETFLNCNHKISMFSSDSTDPDSSSDLKNIPIEKIYLNPKKIMQGLGSHTTKPDICIFNSA